MSALRIHEWVNEYHAPAGQTDTNGLDRLAQRLAEAFHERAKALLDDTPGGVVLLPSLEVECDIDPGCASDQIVGYWSSQLAQAFARALQAGDAVRFPSRAAYYASFIAALARGQSRDGWLYRRFDGLRMLPDAAAIRTLLLEDAATGQAALALLEPAVWPLLLARLPVTEAVRILSAWHDCETVAQHGQSDSDGLMEWAAQARANLPGAIDAPLLALWLIATHGRAATSAALPIGAACWLAALLTLPVHVPPAHLHDIASRTGLDALRKLARMPTNADWLLLLAEAPGTQRTVAASVASALRDPSQPEAQDESPLLLDSPCAGLAWLLPALLDLLPPVAAALPAAQEGDACDWAALFVLAIAAGPRGEQAWRDPFWRSFLRLPPGSAPDYWLARHDQAPARAALDQSLRARAFGLAAVLRLPGPGLAAVERNSACLLGTVGQSEPLPWRDRLALTRLLRRDLRHLGASPPAATLPQGWRELFVTLAQATLRRTANRIPGAARCSLPYLFANVLGVRGTARCTASADAQAWELETERPPLHVLLSLNGMARMRLAWPGARTLAVHCMEPAP